MSVSKSVPQEISNRPSRSFLRRPAFWLATLALLAAVTTARLLKHNPPPFNPLHGDAEDATDSLIGVLAKTPSDERLPLLLRHANDPSPGLRYAAIDKLSEYRSKEVAGPLESAFQDSSALVRMRALESLPDNDPERGFRLLLAALRDDDAQIRSDALSQIASRLGGSALPEPQRLLSALISRLDAENNDEVVTALSLLSRIAGKPWSVKRQAAPEARRAAVAQWKRWAQTNPGAMQVSLEYQNVAPRPPTRTDAAPDFNLSAIDGKPVALADQRGRITLMNFWGTWCGPCQSEIPDLIKIDGEFRAQNVDVIGVALSEDSEKTLRDWCGTHGVAYRQAMATPEIQRVFGDVHEVPVSVLIDRKGQIRYRWDGPSDYATFRAAIKRCLEL